MVENICDEVENNEFSQYFLNENRNENVVANLTVSEQIQKLAKLLDTLSVELHSQVREQHSALLSQASHAGNLDTALNSLSGHMDKIVSGSNRLRNHVNSQFTLVENQTKVLGRLHNVSHVLRSCGNLLQLTSKLKTNKDILKQASLLFELEPYIEDEDLKKIDLIQEERVYVISCRQRIQNFALEELVNGLKENNELQVTNSLKIFINFKSVEKCLHNLIKTFVTDLTQTMKECFAGTDVTMLSSLPKPPENPKESIRRGPGKTPTLTTSQNFRAKLWQSLNWLITEELYEYCQQILLLKNCLENINQTNFIYNDEEDNILKKFWAKVENLLKASFDECPGHISQTLQEGLPKLLSSARALENRLNCGLVFSDRIFQSLEAGYLLKCGGNLKGTSASIDTPSTETVDSLVRSAAKELSAAMVDNRLAKMVADVFNACNKDFWTKIESQVKLGTDTKQVVDIPNSSQLQNISLANIVYFHSESTKKMIDNLGDKFTNSPAAQSILLNLNQANTLNQVILQQVIDSIKATIGIILLSVHREPGLNSDKISVSGPSMYMKELQDFLQRTWTLHIMPFDDKKTTSQCGEQLATCCINLFVNNVSILKPLSVAGRNRIKNDCDHLEIALKPIVPKLRILKKSYRLLRSISTLIVQNPEELIKQDIEEESPVASYLILFLLFSYAGNEVQSPHSAANWSNERLIQWLDGHTSERERLELIAGAIQKYRDSVRRKNSTQYDPVYPLLSSFFERAYKAIT